MVNGPARQPLLPTPVNASPVPNSSSPELTVVGHSCTWAYLPVSSCIHQAKGVHYRSTRQNAVEDGDPSQACVQTAAAMYSFHHQIANPTSPTFSMACPAASAWGRRLSVSLYAPCPAGLPNRTRRSPDMNGNAVTSVSEPIRVP